MHDLVVDLVIIAVCGAVGGFVNVFIGDSGLHLPTIEDRSVFRPGYVGVVIVGLVAAVGGVACNTDSFGADGQHDVPSPPVDIEVV